MPKSIAGYKHGRVPRPIRSRQLLDHAERLLIEKGYHDFAIEDLCRAAGVSRPVVYEHFGSKHGVYLACLRRIRGEFEQAIIAGARNSADVEEFLRNAASAFFGILESEPTRWSLVYGESAGLVGPLADEFFQLRVNTVDHIAGGIGRFVAHAETAELAVFAHLISGAGEQLGRWWLRHPDVPRAYIVDTFVAFCRNGIRPLLESAVSA